MMGSSVFLSIKRIQIKRIQCKKIKYNIRLKMIARIEPAKHPKEAIPKSFPEYLI
jgi:hypothetical protein